MSGKDTGEERFSESEVRSTEIIQTKTQKALKIILKNE